MAKQPPQQPSQPQAPTPDTTPPSPPQPSPTTDKKPINKPVVIISILLLLALGAAVFFAKQYFKLKKDTSPTQPTPSPVSATPTSTIDPTADWETYNNNDFKFVIKYPNNWVINQKPDKQHFSWSIPSLSNSKHYSFNLRVINNPNNLTLKQYIDDISTVSKPDVLHYEGVEETSVNGISAIRLKKVFELNENTERIYLSNENYIFEFSIFLPEQEYDTLLDPASNYQISQQILSTFKFLNQISNLPEGWETYIDREFGFELKYPNTWQQESDTHVFEKGDIFSVVIVGPTQKEATEFYDGGRLTIAAPFIIEESANEWANKYHGSNNLRTGKPNDFSEEKIGSLTFTKVHNCSGLGCFDYYYVKRDRMLYSIVTYAGGESENQHQQTISKMLSSFRFLD